MAGSGETLSKQTSAIIFAVSLYWTVSISMVFVNKYLLSSTDLKFDAPLFITMFQCLVSFGICVVLSISSTLYPNLIKFPSYKVDLKIARDVLPLSLVFVGMIAFNNLCLKYVSISFYMVVRSLSTVCNVAFTYIFFGDRTSNKALMCCGIIIVGFLLGIDQENGLGSLTISGVFYGIMASIFVALNAIYTKKCLNAVDNNVWKLAIYNNFNACFIFLPLIFIFGEHTEIFNFEKLFSSQFWFAMIVSGILGFSMGYVTVLQIQVTSPLTHNVSGTAKAYVQTFLGVIYYSEVKTLLWWLSNILVLAGAGLYSHVRNQEMKSKNKQSTSIPLSSRDSGMKNNDSKDTVALLIDSSAEENEKK